MGKCSALRNGVSYHKLILSLVLVSSCSCSQPGDQQLPHLFPWEQCRSLLLVPAELLVNSWVASPTSDTWSLMESLWPLRELRNAQKKQKSDFERLTALLVLEQISSLPFFFLFFIWTWKSMPLLCLSPKYLARQIPDQIFLDRGNDLKHLSGGYQETVAPASTESASQEI